MKPYVWIPLTLLGAAWLAGFGTGTSVVLGAQAGQFGEMQLMIENLRPSGQPVIPIFDGWYEREDGTYDLCFAYFNLNLKEELDIPLGPDNFIEPADFNGNQPTHFHEVPPGYRRYYCAFTVNVPKNFGDRRVVWTLRRHGQSYSVPGHIQKREYKIENLFLRSESWIAPWVQFVEPTSSTRARGRVGVTAGPVTAVVGQPLTLTTSVNDAEPKSEDGKPRGFEVFWYFHSGPAAPVTFGKKSVKLRGGETTATTTATFSERGEYILRVVGLSGQYQAHCCWTNGYLKVNVAR